MKALAIDSAARKMTVSARNGADTATLVLDIGMKQSARLLPAIDAVLGEVGIAPAELDFTALTEGPGTFTGLRLSFSALKAIELAHGKPIYAIPTLDAYAYPFRDFDGAVVSVIDAKKGQFFASVHRDGSRILNAQDTDSRKISEFLEKSKIGSAVLTGPDSGIFLAELEKSGCRTRFFALDSAPLPTDALFEMAQRLFDSGEPPLRDYDGPNYLRKSEAELGLN